MNVRQIDDVVDLITNEVIKAKNTYQLLDKSLAMFLYDNPVLMYTCIDDGFFNKYPQKTHK